VAVGAALATAILLAGWGIAEAGRPASASAPASAPAPSDSGAGAFSDSAPISRAADPLPASRDDCGGTVLTADRPGRDAFAPGEFDHFIFIVRIAAGGSAIVGGQSHLEVHGPLQV
jgi:hypothetical protein